MSKHLLSQLKLEGISGKKKEARVVKAIDKEEPIAIIGMSCRFPGSDGDIDGYWNMLEDAI